MYMFNKEAFIVCTKGCENVLRARIGVFICSPFVWQSPPSAWCASPCRFWRHDQSELHSETHRTENASSSNLIRTMVLWHDVLSPIWHVFLFFPQLYLNPPQKSVQSLSFWNYKVPLGHKWGSRWWKNIRPHLKVSVLLLLRIGRIHQRGVWSLQFISTVVYVFKFKKTFF